MLYYITFYYTFSVIVIILKVPSLQILPQNTTEWAFAEARQFRFLVITFPALEKTLTCNWRGWYCQQPSGDCCYWRILLSVRRSQDSGFRMCESVGSESCQLPAVDTWSVATQRREWQTTPIQHCWTWRRSVCPTGSTMVWGRLQMQWIQWTTAVRRRCWQQPPAPWNWSWRPLPSLCRRHRTTTAWIWDRRLSLRTISRRWTRAQRDCRCSSAV